MVAWRVANSLTVLRNEVNAKWPTRSKDSDGSIGDASHASRSSDHNPWIVDKGGPNVVSAIDITHDPASGCDSYALAEFLKAHQDPRIKYIISNGKIAAGHAGPSPWVWRKYSGANKHDHHVHISVEDDKVLYDNTTSWGVYHGSMPAHNEPAAKSVPPTLRLGAKGDNVLKLQTMLGTVIVDGDFGAKTESAVIRFQRLHSLYADGVVGPATWTALGGAAS